MQLLNDRKLSSVPLGHEDENDEDESDEIFH